jgi:hypothetical protein
MLKVMDTEDGGMVLISGLTVFGQQGADHIDSPSQTSRIIGAFDGEAGDMLFLEPVEYV